VFSRAFAGRRAGSVRRPALVAAVIAAAVAALFVAVHESRGGASPASAQTGTSPASPMASMNGMGGPPSSGPSAVPAQPSSGVMTVRGASLPASPTSSSGPSAMAMVPLGQTQWEGMSIQARTSAPATFELFNGTSQRLVRPSAKDSFHLMVMLADTASGVAIPYSSVWATITKGGKVVFDERLWPMISRYMGPHFGNNVALPSAGLYRLTLLVSPPVAARHLEYKGLWLQPHRVHLTFRWVPGS